MPQAVAVRVDQQRRPGVIRSNATVTIIGTIVHVASAKQAGSMRFEFDIRRVNSLRASFCNFDSYRIDSEQNPILLPGGKLARSHAVPCVPEVLSKPVCSVEDLTVSKEGNRLLFSDGYRTAVVDLPVKLTLPKIR